MHSIFTNYIRLGLSIFLFLATSSVSANFSHLWGIGFRGGDSDLGFIYRTDSNATNKQIVHHFAGGEGGQYPRGDLILGLDQKLYGAASGGENGQGILYRVDPVSLSFEIVHHFVSASPQGSIIRATNGNLYGYLIDGFGKIFEFNPSSESYSEIHQFDGDDGRSSLLATRLVEREANVLYGVTALGGENDVGVIFRLDANDDSFEVLHHFDGTVGTRPDSIDLFSDGLFYGIAGPGSNRRGLIFNFDADTRSISKIHDFGEDYGLVVPRLLEASDGNVYGLTEIGGQYVHGSFFKYDIQADEAEHLFEFQFGAPHIPDSHLIEAFNGRIYGTTRYGGTGLGRGTIFEFDLASGSFRFVENLDDGFPLESALTEVGEREVTSLSLSAATDAISENRGILQIMATVLPSKASNQPVIWRVSDPNIASISQAGRLQARSNGRVVISATANKGLGVSDSITITISNQKENDYKGQIVAPIYLLLDEN